VARGGVPHGVDRLDVLPVGSAWILLLKWDVPRNRFKILSGQHGVLAIDGNVVRPLGTLCARSGQRYSCVSHQ
jgi:hypothetical protein